MTQILIIAHAPLATALKTVAAHTYAEAAASIRVLDVEPAEDIAPYVAAARAMVAGLEGAPTLIFTDAVGASPYNVAICLLDNPQARLVVGVNVPMLWRTLCQAIDTPIDSLVDISVEGAKQGVFQVAGSRPQEQAQRLNPNDQAGRHDQQ